MWLVVWVRKNISLMESLFWFDDVVQVRSLRMHQRRCKIQNHLIHLYRGRDQKKLQGDKGI